MGAESARHNWLWWLDLRAGARFLTDRVDPGLTRALAAFGVSLIVGGADALRSDELFEGGVLRVTAVSGVDPRERLATDLHGIRTRLRDGATICVVHDAAEPTGGILPAARSTSLSSVRRALARLGVQDLRAMRLDPLGTASRVMVPDAKVAWSAYLELDEGLTRVGRLRATVSRLGVHGVVLPSWVVVGRT